jgi:hypothetical protein
MGSTFPPTEPTRQSCDELLALLARIRKIAYDWSLPPIEATGAIRDEFGVYEGRIPD